MTSPASPTEDTPRFSEPRLWILFCLAVFALKFVLLAADPLPKFIMGDSGSYIATALSGWIPEDRSFLYGYVIRWTSVWTQSLTSLLLLQLFLSAITSVCAALMCRSIFRLPLSWSYVFGLLCAADPLQLLYERYVMTEVISLCLYAFVVHHAFRYLKYLRVRDLVIVQAISVLLIGFRISFLPLVEVNTVVLPLMAFFPDALKRLRRTSAEGISLASTFKVCGLHLFLSVILMVVLHGGYKRTYGWIANREPAYLHTTGMTLLAFWAPILQPEDSADPRLADLIKRGDELALKNPAYRNMQLYTPDMLLDRLSKIEPAPSKADLLARKTALHALWRDPLGVLGLTWHTYSDYWSAGAIKQFAEKDFSFANPPGGDLIGLLAYHFHLAQNNVTTKSLLQWYYVAAWPYYFLLLLAPLLSGLAILLKVVRPYATLLFVHICIMMGMAMTFGSETIRFLQPISLMTLLVLALWTNAGLKRLERRKDGAFSDPIEPGGRARECSFSPL